MAERSRVTKFMDNKGRERRDGTVDATMSQSGEEPGHSLWALQAGVGGFSGSLCMQRGRFCSLYLPYS